MVVGIVYNWYFGNLNQNMISDGENNLNILGN